MHHSNSFVFYRTKQNISQEHVSSRMSITLRACSVWYTSGVVAKIVDFGLSRLRLRGSGPEEVIYNVRDQFSEMFNAAVDADKVLLVS